MCLLFSYRITFLPSCCWSSPVGFVLPELQFPSRGSLSIILISSILYRECSVTDLFTGLLVQQLLSSYFSFFFFNIYFCNNIILYINKLWFYLCFYQHYLIYKRIEFMFEEFNRFPNLSKFNYYFYLNLFYINYAWLFPTIYPYLTI